jgi:hypothetical protein
MDFFVASVGSVCSGTATGMEVVGHVLCAGMAAVLGYPSADGYDAAVSAATAPLQDRGQEEKAAQPPAQ